MKEHCVSSRARPTAPAAAAALGVLLLGYLAATTRAQNVVLYTGGIFSTAGGIAASHIARYDGTAWSAMGTGMNSDVSALAVHNGILFAGGSFTMMGTQRTQYLALWNGTAWSAVEGGVNASVSSLQIYNGDLFVGGSFTSIGGVPTRFLARWNGTVWSAAGDPAVVSSGVSCLAVGDGTLYASLTFTVTQWNGTAWSVVGPATNAAIEAIAVYQGALYVGGYFSSAGSVSASRIARWNGTFWASAGSGFNSFVAALAVYNNSLFAGGAFTSSGGVPLSYIAMWNGVTWSAVISGTDAIVRSFATFGGTLYVGGDFVLAGGVAASRVARWNGVAWSGLAGGPNDHVLALAATCASTPDGFFGPSCASCALCALHGTCYPGLEGNCTCASGWDGPTCSECAADFFGPDCTTCAACMHGQCHAGVAGNCSCSTGWSGATCDECAGGFFGANCTSCNLCSPHGTCYDSLEGNCTCDVGWGGTTCGACLVGYFGASCVSCSVCAAHGTCHDGREGNCTCDVGWVGTVCDACAPAYFGEACAPCSNCSVFGPGAGVCSDGSAGNGSCVCYPGYSGTRCENASCQIVDCNDRGTCTNTTSPDGRFICECFFGYMPPFCELPYPCYAAGGCSNNGTCAVDANGGLTCACVFGYAGELCEQALGCRQPTQACVNGGTCAAAPASPEGVTCVCPWAYGGPTCADTSQFSLVTVVVASVGMDVVTAALVVAVAVEARRRHARSTAPAWYLFTDITVVYACLGIADLVLTAFFVQLVWSAQPASSSLILTLGSVVVYGASVAGNAFAALAFLVSRAAMAAHEGAGAEVWFRAHVHRAAMAVTVIVAIGRARSVALLHGHFRGWTWAQAPWSAEEAVGWLLRAASVLLVFTDVPLLLLKGWAVLDLGVSTVVLLALVVSAQLCVVTVAELLLHAFRACGRWRASWTAGPRGKELADVSRPIGAVWSESPLYTSK